MDDSEFDDCILQEPNITCITIPDDNSIIECTKEDQQQKPEISSSTTTDKNSNFLTENDNNNKEQQDNNSVPETTAEQQQDCLFEIVFNNEENFNELKDGIRQAIEPFLLASQLLINIEENFNALKLSIYKKRIEDDQLFVFSLNPNNKIESNIGDIPSYKRSTNETLNLESSKKIIKNTDDECQRPSASACFNCGGNHALKDCEEPRNQQKINKARKLFTNKSERYHIDIEQRFAHLKPGKLSRTLKDALGLRSRELPVMFYRMRQLGYPPGWLEECKVSSSGIAVFDSEGNSVIEESNKEYSNNPTYQYDASKLIDFPGFNSDAGSGYYDDYKYYCVPPMQAKDSKEEFIKSLGANFIKTGYKRKKLVIPETSNSTEDSTSICISTDMDVEDIDNISMVNHVYERPPPPSTEPPEITAAEPPPPPPTLSPPLPNENEDKLTEKTSNEDNIFMTPSKNNIFMTPSKNTQNNNIDSPYLAELELKQQQLLREILELEKNPSADQSIIDLDSTVNDSSIKQNTNLNENSSEQSSAFNTPESKLSYSKESVLGTPLLKFSPYEKLPNGDNFKQGVSDVINFENLPDSTGKYEQMKQVISKVRRKITKLNNED